MMRDGGYAGATDAGLIGGRSRAWARARLRAAVFVDDSDPTKSVSFLLNINMRKSHRAAHLRDRPSSGPRTISVLSPNTRLQTGTEIRVYRSSFSAMKARETTT